MEAALGLDAGASRVFQSGTFTENPLSVAAGHAALDASRPSRCWRSPTGWPSIRPGCARPSTRPASTSPSPAAPRCSRCTSVSERSSPVATSSPAIPPATRRFLLAMTALGVLGRRAIQPSRAARTRTRTRMSSWATSRRRSSWRSGPPRARSRADAGVLDGRAAIVSGAATESARRRPSRWRRPAPRARPGSSRRVEGPSRRSVRRAAAPSASRPT